jgi:hypothetical protein
MFTVGDEGDGEVYWWQYPLMLAIGAARKRWRSDFNYTLLEQPQQIFR